MEDAVDTRLGRGRANSNNRRWQLRKVSPRDGTTSAPGCTRALEGTRAERNARRVEERAEQADENAAVAIAFASFAVQVAEAAVLEANRARAAAAN